MIRLKHVQRWTDKATGKTYYYFRRSGLRRTRLAGQPGSQEFMAAYQAALDGLPLATGEKRTKPGSINAAAVAYYNSAAFHTLASSTRQTYRNILERFRRDYGDLPVATLETWHIQKFVNDKAKTPAAARNFLNVLRCVLDSAQSINLCKANSARAVRGPKRKRGAEGFKPWTEEAVNKFRETYPSGSRARLALVMLLDTAQRRSDVVTMEHRHLWAGGLHITQQKTKKQLTIPIDAASELAIELTAGAAGKVFFLETALGKKFSAAGFGNWFREICDKAGLRGYSAHGLRKRALIRLAEAGCTEREIMAISGHESVNEVSVYVRAADQSKLAIRAKAKVGT